MAHSIFRELGDNTKGSKVFLIKLAHAIIFFLMSLCLVYVLYCALTRTYDWTLLLALSAISLEGLALLLNHGRCPLTSLAEKYGAEKGSVTDILLPRWMARNVFRFSTILVVIELILLAFGYFTVP